MSDTDAKPKRESRLRWIIAAVIVPLVAAAISAAAGFSPLERSVEPGPDKVSPSVSVSPTASSLASLPAAPPASAPPTSPSQTSPSQTGALQAAAPKVPPPPPDNSPLARCRRGESSNVDVTLNLPGSTHGTTYPVGTTSAPNPPNDLRPGDVLRLTGWGAIYVAAVGKSYGPDGSGERAPAGWTAPDLSKFSAVTIYNTDPGGWIGDHFPAGKLAECTAYPYSPMARLFVRINAPGGDWTGNSGEWRFRLQVYRG